MLKWEANCSGFVYDEAVKKMSDTLQDGLTTALGALVYALSLPERSLRSLAALVGGGTSLLTSTLLPDSLRGTTSYRVTVGLFQEFLLERVAEVKREAERQHLPLKDKFVQRKILGNVLEAAGLLTMRLSPLWVLAIAADAAAGSKTFLNRLVERLKANGVLAEDATPSELVDVLEAIQDASSKSAAVIDLPPLTRAELEQLAAEMQASYTRILGSGSQLLPEISGLWQSITEVAQQENVSLERLLGIMTVDAAQVVKKGVGTAAAVGQTGALLFDERILQSYKRTLGRISHEGLERYMSTEMHPFLQLAKAHFKVARRTRLERWLLGTDSE